MALMIVGIAIWFAAHLLRRLTPSLRGALREKLGVGPARGVIALTLIGSVVLMVIGYRAAEVIPIYAPPPFGGYVNNLLMLIAVFLFIGGSVGSWLATRMRHPMLIATKIWAIAHLLVNGDLASVILFGSMLVWAVVEVIVINRTAPAWEKTTGTKPGAQDAGRMAAALVLFLLIAAVHIWLGYNPFLGSYG